MTLLRQPPEVGELLDVFFTVSPGAAVDKNQGQPRADVARWFLNIGEKSLSGSWVAAVEHVAGEGSKTGWLTYRSPTAVSEVHTNGEGYLHFPINAKCSVKGSFSGLCCLGHVSDPGQCPQGTDHSDDCVPSLQTNYEKQAISQDQDGG